MKVTLNSRIDFSETGPRLTTGFFALARRIQSAALLHCEKAEGGSQKLIQSDAAWVLNAFCAKILAYPGPGEDLEITTWSRGFKGVRAFRDFSIRVDGNPMAFCSSVWLRISLSKKRICKINPEMMAPYEQENETRIGHLVEDYKPREEKARELVLPVLPRASDIDPLGHVNNSVYFDFLDTAARKAWPGSNGIGFLRIRFIREMGFDARPMVGLGWDESPRFFSIFDENTIFAAGEMAPLGAAVDM